MARAIWERQRRGERQENAVYNHNACLMLAVNDASFPKEHFDLSAECAICLSDFTKCGSEDKITSLPCNKKHYFHPKCIKEWFKTSS